MEFTSGIHKGNFKIILNETCQACYGTGQGKRIDSKEFHVCYGQFDHHEPCKKCEGKGNITVSTANSVEEPQQ